MLVIHNKNIMCEARFLIAAKNKKLNVCVDVLADMIEEHNYENTYSYINFVQTFGKSLNSSEVMSILNQLKSRENVDKASLFPMFSNHMLQDMQEKHDTADISAMLAEFEPLVGETLGFLQTKLQVLMYADYESNLDEITDTLAKIDALDQL